MSGEYSITSPLLKHTVGPTTDLCAMPAAGDFFLLWDLESSPLAGRVSVEDRIPTQGVLFAQKGVFEGIVSCTLLANEHKIE